MLRGGHAPELPEPFHGLRAGVLLPALWPLPAAALLLRGHVREHALELPAAAREPLHELVRVHVHELLVRAPYDHHRRPLRDQLQMGSQFLTTLMTKAQHQAGTKMQRPRW